MLELGFFTRNSLKCFDFFFLRLKGLLELLEFLFLLLHEALSLQDLAFELFCLILALSIRFITTAQAGEEVLELRLQFLVLCLQVLLLLLRPRPR